MQACKLVNQHNHAKHGTFLLSPMIPWTQVLHCSVPSQSHWSLLWPGGLTLEWFWHETSKQMITEGTKLWYSGNCSKRCLDLQARRFVQFGFVPTCTFPGDENDEVTYVDIFDQFQAECKLQNHWEPGCSGWTFASICDRFPLAFGGGIALGDKKPPIPQCWHDEFDKLSHCRCFLTVTLSIPPMCFQMWKSHHPVPPSGLCLQRNSSDIKFPLLGGSLNSICFRQCLWRVSPCSTPQDSVRTASSSAHLHLKKNITAHINTTSRPDFWRIWRWVLSHKAPSGSHWARWFDWCHIAT